ncbi:MAG: response regulator, partial [Paramuribaculum sp.]|nr:response regulator [Paramuribaculum sp.]
MSKYTILWADDEIDMLKPHILFLKSKDYDVVTANSGQDALALADQRHFDLIILDENMPGLTGIETLSRIKMNHPSVPVIMITKNEEEDLMDQAVGSKIADYLIKPVNPKQILLSIKKNLHSARLVSENSLTGYRRDFIKISNLINDARTIGDWIEAYRNLTHWELELAGSDNEGME